MSEQRSEEQSERPPDVHPASPEAQEIHEKSKALGGESLSPGQDGASFTETLRDA